MASMEEAYTFAHTMELSEIVTGYSWEDDVWYSGDYRTPATETADLEAGDYILLKVTASNWMFSPAESNPSYFTD